MKTEFPEQPMETFKNQNHGEDYDARLKPMSDISTFHETDLDKRIDKTNVPDMDTENNSHLDGEKLTGTDDISGLNSENDGDLLDRRMEPPVENHIDSLQNEQTKIDFEYVDESANADKRELCNSESIEKDPLVDRVSELIGKSQGMKEIYDAYPDKQSLWSEKLNIIDDPHSSSLEVLGAERTLKGQLLEYATRKTLSEKGFDVEEHQYLVKGDMGDVKPDVVATNNTDHSIGAFGYTIKPGGKISVECKCGNKEYIKSEFREHLPKQLAGMEGSRVLITTSDVRDISDNYAENVCKQYDTRLVPTNISVADVAKAIKEMGA